MALQEHADLPALASRLRCSSLLVTSGFPEPVSYLCQEDNFGLGGTTFFKCLWNCVYDLDNVLPSPEFDVTDEGKIKALANGMYVRSGRTTSGCIGALDEIDVSI